MAGVDPYDTYDWDHVPDLRAAVDTARATLAASRTSVDTRPVEQGADTPVAAVETLPSTTTAEGALAPAKLKFDRRHVADCGCEYFNEPFLAYLEAQQLGIKLPDTRYCAQHGGRQILPVEVAASSEAAGSETAKVTYYIPTPCGTCGNIPFFCTCPMWDTPQDVELRAAKLRIADLEAELAAIRIQYQHDYIPTVPRGF